MELLVLIEPLSSNGPEKKLLEIDVDFFSAIVASRGRFFMLTVIDISPLVA